MPVTATLSKRHGVGGVTYAVFTLAFTGNYTTGGDSLDFAPIMGFTNRQPDFVQIEGINGYNFQYDFTNKLLPVFSTATTQLTNGAAYPAGVGSDTQIRAYIVYVSTPKLA